MEVYRSAAVFAALLLLAHSGHAQQALCQRSPQNPGEVYTPNIPDFYFTPANAAAFSSINLTETVSGTTYVFTIPAVGPERNCSGTVISLQFCYHIDSTGGGARDIFDFLVLRRNSNTFTVIDKFSVRANPRNCVNNYCCTSDALSGSNVFEAPLTQFNIGLVVSNVNARPLIFLPSATEYNIPQYQSTLGLSGPQNGATFTLGEQELVNGNSLILLRFFLEPNPLPTTEPVTTMAVTTTKPTMATQPTTESTTAATTIMTTESATAATTPATTMVTESTTAATTSPTSMTTQATTVTMTNPTTDAMTTRPTTDAMTTQPTTDAMTTRPTTDAMTTRPTTDAMTTRPITDAMTTLPTTDAMTTEPTTDARTTEPTTDAMTTEPTTDAMTTRPTTDATTTRPTTDAITTEPTTDAMTEPTTDARTTLPTTDARTTLPTTDARTTRPTTDARTTRPTTDTRTSPSPGIVTDQAMTTTEPPTPETTPNGASATDDEPNSSGLNGGIIGGILGGIVVPLVILVAICLLLLIRSRRNRKYKAHSPDNGVGFFTNALYEDMEEKQQGGHYAGTGPYANSEAKQPPLPPVYSKVKKPKPLPAFDDDLKGVVNEGYSFALSPSNEYADVDVGSEPLAATTTLDSSYDQLIRRQRTMSESPVKDEENIYMVPGVDVGTLYSQLDQFKTQKLRRDKIGLGHELGSGQFGIVYRGVWLSPDGEVEVAIKTLKQGADEQDRVKFLQEAAIMGQFKHPNVVSMYGVVTKGEPVLIVLELLMKGDLKNHLVNSRSEESESLDCHTLLSYCRQVASGMNYLANKAFVHRDLAARNILVSDDEICKIADFGMTRDLMNEDYYVSGGGQIPVKWTAPEALYYKKYSTASDIWSFGVLMYEIWSVGHKPFKNITNSETVKLLDAGVRLTPPPGCPRTLYSIMIACWHPTASERPSFTEITRQLSLPDPKLLKWSKGDKSVHPEAAKLEADLLCAEDLYKDLQNRYIH